MNSLTLLIIVLAWFALGYFAYSKFLEKKLVKPNDSVKTPASRKRGIDYKPSRKEFLFGHHFASIAGAGPIIGPILAVSYFGWLAVILWIAIGTFLIGAVHDYLTLMISVKNDARGIALVSEHLVGKRTFYVFSSLLWFTLMLVITVFAVSSAQSLVEVPELVIPFFGITFTAIFLGVGVYKLKKNRIMMSILAVILATFFIYLGLKFPLSFPASLGNTQILWISLLMIYAMVVSLIPVWLILQPRDYVSAIGLFLFLALGVLAVIIGRPEINAPLIITSSGFPLWPILFITVACGAVSGFHALVASGTSSKQLAKEKDGRFVAYGGMIAEGIVALLVVIFVSAGLSWGVGDVGNLNFFSNALATGWIVAFGKGFANLVESAFPFLSNAVLVILGSLIVNLFILTSLDTSTRVGRMIASEALPNRSKWNNKFFLTILILIPAYFLAITNSYASLWKLFGASNQLIASVVLLMISAYLVEKRKPSRYTLIPGLFMIVTTLGALFYQLLSKNGFLFGITNIPLIVISIVLILFALIVFFEVLSKLRRKKR
jgi:carbon starvation protein